MTQPLFAGIVTAVGSKRPGQAMGLNVFLLFLGFGAGSAVFGSMLDIGLRNAILIFCYIPNFLKFHFDLTFQRRKKDLDVPCPAPLTP